MLTGDVGVEPTWGGGEDICTMVAASSCSAILVPVRMKEVCYFKVVGSLLTCQIWLEISQILRSWVR